MLLGKVLNSMDLARLNELKPSSLPSSSRSGSASPGLKTGADSKAGADEVLNHCQLRVADLR